MRIATERLVLRDYVIDDWPDVLAYQRDPRYFRFYPWTGRAEAGVRDLVQKFVDMQVERPRRRFQMAIALRESEKLIGSCGIRRKLGNDWEAELGYELAPEYWGRGYATEAARAMIDFGFKELGLHRVYAWCIADNAASAKILERLGLRLEGRLREIEYFKGRWWDTLHYGLLEGEWGGSGATVQVDA